MARAALLARRLGLAMNGATRFRILAEALPLPTAALLKQSYLLKVEGLIRCYLLAEVWLGYSELTQS